MEHILIWIFIIIAGFGTMIYASQRAIHHATMLARQLSVSPFIIGITLISIGTDLPEIANSVMASAAGHGDLNAGDSIGSVATQMTLVLGLLPFFTGAFSIKRSYIIWLGSLTIVALGLGGWLMSDGYISRTDAMLLFAAWILTSAILIKYVEAVPAPTFAEPESSKLKHGLLALFALVFVAVGAGAAVKGIVELAIIAKIPEFYISFFGASLGTSLPELVLNVTAIQKRIKELALGDVLGSCLVDATLSLSAGPLLFPVAVTASLAVQGVVTTMIIVALVTLVVSFRTQHDRYSGAILVLLYGLAYYLLLSGH